MRLTPNNRDIIFEYYGYNHFEKLFILLHIIEKHFDINIEFQFAAYYTRYMLYCTYHLNKISNKNILKTPDHLKSTLITMKCSGPTLDDIMIESNNTYFYDQIIKLKTTPQKCNNYIMDINYFRSLRYIDNKEDKIKFIYRYWFNMYSNDSIEFINERINHIILKYGLSKKLML